MTLKYLTVDLHNIGTHKNAPRSCPSPALSSLLPQCPCAPPRALGGAVMGMRPSSLNSLNCTATLLADRGSSSADTCSMAQAAAAKLSTEKESQVL